VTRVRTLFGSLIVLGTFLVAVSPPGNRGALADGAADFLALWPEQTLEGALATQLAVDDGDTALAWRTNARDVALRFVSSVMGWRAPIIEEVRPYSGDRFEYLNVQVAETGAGTGVDAPSTHTLWLQRILRGGSTGIWSVVTVRSPRISEPRWTPRMPFRYGHVVETWSGGLPDGAGAIAGWTLRAGCGVETRGRPIYYHRGWTRFEVNELGVRPWCLVRKKNRDQRLRTYPGNVVIARAEGLGANDVRHLFHPAAPPDQPILDLTATTVHFGPGWATTYLQRRAWSADPDDTPICPDHRIELADPAAGWQSGYNDWPGVQVYVRTRGACRIREVFALSVSSAAGPLDQPPPFSATSFVRGEPPRDEVSAQWAVSNICARGRAVFTIRGAGQQVTFPAPPRYFRRCDRSEPPGIFDLAALAHS
jgi:hypothetical protein